MEKNPLHPDGQAGPVSQTAEHRERCKTTKTVPESDKDSGYSDVASECLSSVEQTDCEDGPLPGHWNAKTSMGRSDFHPENVVLKNVLVDQETSSDPNVHSWTVRPSLQLLSSSQILLFPPAVATTKTETTCKRRAKYLPILNSYTKIAPYPCHFKPGSSLPLRCKKRSDASRQGQAKRTHCGTQGQNLNEAPVPLGSDASETPLRRSVIISSEKTVNKRQGSPAPRESAGTTDDSAAKSSSQDVPPAGPQVAPIALGCKSNKKQRFQNTWEILHRSGLLGIAMKTKELVRLNHATQNQLEKLKEQVQLYNIAMGSKDPSDWKKLEESMTNGTKEAAHIAVQRRRESIQQPSAVLRQDIIRQRKRPLLSAELQRAAGSLSHSERQPH